MHALVLAAMLHADPVGDAVGGGSLVPPTSAVLADVGAFDLASVEVLDEPTWAVRLKFASSVDPVGTSTGLGVTIADVYVDLGPGGSNGTLPGVGLVLPRGLGWELAFRVHADEAHAIVAPPDAALDGGEAATVEARLEPVEVVADGSSVTLRSSLPRTVDPVELYAAAGVYDPFSPDGWREVTATPSPWAFSSPTPALPVIDLLAIDGDAQAVALSRGIFPRRSERGGTTPWLVLMVGGAMVAVAGVALRLRGVVGDGEGRPWLRWRTRPLQAGDDLPWIEAHEIAHLDAPSDAAQDDRERDETTVRGDDGLRDA